VYNHQKKNEMKYLRINEATYAGDLKVLLKFNDGAEVLLDVGSWIRKNPHPQYERYLNEKKFKKFFLDDMGNIAWGKNRDLYFPIEQLHEGFIS